VRLDRARRVSWVRVEYDDAFSSLRRTPQTLRSYFEGLSGAWLEGDEGLGTWTPFETLAHIVHIEPTWMKRLQHIAQHGDAEPFPLVDRSGHLDVLGHLDVGELLDRFSEVRADGLERLAELDYRPEKPGLHGELGTVLMGQLLAAWVTHDLNHLGQIVKTMAKQYRTAIGPWRTFLAIVDAE